MRALFLALISLLVVACGSEFANEERSTISMSSSVPAVVRATAGGSSGSDIASAIVAGTTAIAGDSSFAGAPTVGGAGGAGDATRPSTTAIVPSTIARVLYWSSSPVASSSSIDTDIELVNISKENLDLAEYRLRYWFTAELESGATLVPESSGTLTTQLVSIGTVIPSRRGADHYVDIAFAPGSWIMAGSSELLTFGAHKSSWGAFDQSDDFSYPGSLAPGAELGMVGVYHNGVLVAGLEP